MNFASNRHLITIYYKKMNYVPFFFVRLCFVEYSIKMVLLWRWINIKPLTKWQQKWMRRRIREKVTETWRQQELNDREIFTSNGTQLSHAIFVKVLMLLWPTQYLNHLTIKHFSWSESPWALLYLIHMNVTNIFDIYSDWVSKVLVILRIKFGILF